MSSYSCLECVLNEGLSEYYKEYYICMGCAHSIITKYCYNVDSIVFGELRDNMRYGMECDKCGTRKSIGFIVWACESHYNAVKEIASERERKLREWMESDTSSEYTSDDDESSDTHNNDSCEEK
jgi:hypothetical protein